MVPRTLEACVQHTSAVLSSNNGRRLEGVRMGDGVLVVVGGGGEVGIGGHHFMVWFCERARRSHGEMLASWSREERMRVELGGRERMRERLEKS